MSNLRETGGMVHATIIELKMFAQQAMQMGNNEGEAAQIDGLVTEVMSGTLDPQKAVERAREIINRKNEV